MLVNPPPSPSLNTKNPTIKPDCTDEELLHFIELCKPESWRYYTKFLRKKSIVGWRRGGYRIAIVIIDRKAEVWRFSSIDFSTGMFYDTLQYKILPNPRMRQNAIILTDPNMAKNKSDALTIVDMFGTKVVLFFYINLQVSSIFSPQLNLLFTIDEGDEDNPDYPFLNFEIISNHFPEFNYEPE